MHPLLQTIVQRLKDAVELFKKLLIWAKPYAQKLFKYALKNKKQIVVGLALGGFLFFALPAFVIFLYYLTLRGDLRDDLVKQKGWLQGEGETVIRPPIRIYGVDNTLIGEFLPERDSRISLRQCKNEMTWLNRATVSSEDRDFYSHSGISSRGILRAFVNNIRRFGAKEGGGSITMQLVRNLYTTRKFPAYFRKFFEIYVALDAEDLLDKHEILCLYTNKIYMGEGRIGAEEASWFYFRKPPTKLDAAESAMIVGLFPSPVRYSPLNNIELSLKKQRVVMNSMAAEGYLAEKDIEPLLKTFKRKYTIEENATHSGLIGAYGASRDFRLNAAPSANEVVRQFLYESIPEEILREGDLKVYTTIDPVRQDAALRAMRNGLDKVRGEMQAKSKMDPRDTEKVVRRLNGALVSLNPSTGHIQALVGGYGITEGGNMTDRVFNMKRQPGSVIKGFLYAVALDNEVYTVNSEVVDEKINYSGYSPKNWYHSYKGPMSLRQAVALSVNTVAVKTLAQVGVGEFRKRLASALELGYFEAQQRFSGDLSLALGTGELSPMELARLYAPLLNDGISIRPQMIKQVIDKDGTVLWEWTESPEASILSKNAAAGAIYLLESVMEESDEGTASWIGTMKRKNPEYLPFDVAGKSGTVQNVSKKFKGLTGVHDAWFVGLVPEDVTIVWIGHDEGAPFPGGGSASAAPIWATYANAALPGRVTGSFPEVNVDTPVNQDPDLNSIDPHDTHKPLDATDPSQGPNEHSPEQNPVP